jgi:putative nucleotidyltransferase-like protein
LRHSDELLAAAGNLLLDAVAAEVVSTLLRVGIRSILLRGPVIARWLYDDDTLRPYSDIDLLVAPSEFAAAEGVLADLGFVQHSLEVALPTERPRHAHTWERVRVIVDLHRTLIGIAAPPEQVWAELGSETADMTVGGAQIKVLRPPALAVMIALHAAHQGAEFDRLLQDLERALERASAEVWEEAAALARALEAIPAFATGLRLLPTGETVAARLGLSSEHWAKGDVEGGKTWHLARTLGWLVETPGLAAKLRFLVGRLFPAPAVMRSRSPLARRGRLGLLLAYPWRIVLLLRYVLPAVRTLRAVRRRPSDG